VLYCLGGFSNEWTFKSCSKHRYKTRYTVATVLVKWVCLEVNRCQLSNDTLYRIPKRRASDWIVDDSIVNLLHNDLQELILCTRPQERVIFQLQDPVQLNKTLRISHELELIAQAFEINEVKQNGAPFASFLCPESGAALVVR